MKSRLRALLLYLILTPQISFSQWSALTTSELGNSLFIDYERIKQANGYVYWWSLFDYLEPVNGVFSAASYNEGDCDLLRFRTLQSVFYYQPMGRGRSFQSSSGITAWGYPPPESLVEISILAACRSVK